MSAETAIDECSIPIVPARYFGYLGYDCLDCAGKGVLNVPCTWEHADEDKAWLNAWCDVHLPDNAVEVDSGGAGSAASNPRPIFLNDMTYVDGEEDPIEALKTTLAFSVEDWGASRAMAWTWGIVHGWGDEEDEDDAHPELALRFGWSDEAVARLRRLHSAFEALSGSEPPGGAS